MQLLCLYSSSLCNARITIKVTCISGALVYLQNDTNWDNNDYSITSDSGQLKGRRKRHCDRHDWPTNEAGRVYSQYMLIIFQCSYRLTESVADGVLLRFLLTP